MIESSSRCRPASSRLIVDVRIGGLGAGLFDFTPDFESYLQPIRVEDVGDVGSIKSIWDSIYLYIHIQLSKASQNF